MGDDANAERGEVCLPLGSKDYVLRPSFTACQAIERKTGRSLRALAQAAQSGDLAMPDAGVIAAELIRAGAAPGDIGAQRGDPEKFAELMFEVGLMRCQLRIAIVLMAAVTGGASASGELRPVAATRPIGTATGD